ncbi:winged helix-turn-helix domain-containing protein [Rhizobium sp. CNPSo 4039]|uniref:ATP-binding protein n=1 Tax=Rhizobium sp. CNPSo 4039 TaxID=3021409 RepID=UPI00254EE32A|nr:winged helix-turn-helix domain-containing protein [Rhizobium sp. CNPSo 4039]MDK4716027.1 winged helix-turn-helix domain-containing protein [Rhizobium sp. CNPSo 4039]
MSVYCFENFSLDVDGRLLSAQGAPLHLGSRAFDILATLVARAGQVVSKEELIKAVWPATSVDEGALRVHLVSLRKSLGGRAKDFIANVPGRGYQFIPEVCLAVQASAGTAERGPRSTLPNQSVPLIGREQFISDVQDCLASTPLLTIVGPGGIGKTSVAIAVANVMATTHRVVFLDLASVTEGNNLAPSLASALGQNVYGSNAMPAILSELDKGPTLIVLDNCEHVVDAAADVAEEILRRTGATILATSREPLRTTHEKIRQLPPLTFPLADLDCLERSSYSALELFISLVSLVDDRNDFDDPQVLADAADIVRRLDGIPLAIELAAARSLEMDLSGLRRSLVDPFTTLRRGRRTAPPRQQTLRAALDWSYQTLSPHEAELLQRLSVFSGTFRSEDALAVSSRQISDDEFYDAFDGLFLKSLLAPGGEGGRYRLLATTRDYAMEKLAASPYERECRLAHARHCKGELVAAESDWNALASEKWFSRYGGLIHDLRSALAFSFSAVGEEQLAVELAASSNIIWTQLGFMTEQLEVAERALELIRSMDQLDPPTEMHLRLSYGGTLYHICPSKEDEFALNELTQALAISELLDDGADALRATGGISAIHCMNGRYDEALAAADRFDRRFGHVLPNAVSRSRAPNLFSVGNFNEALNQANITMLLAKGRTRGTLNNGASYDQRLSPLATVVKTQWIQGRFRDAANSLHSALNEAEALDHAISTCLYLSVSAYPTALGMGDTALARTLLKQLLKDAEDNSLIRWLEWGQTYRAVANACEAGDQGLFNKTLTPVTGARFENGLIAGGELANEETIDRALSGEPGWCRAELLRLRGELGLEKNAGEARERLRESYDVAKAQGAGFWELRAARSLLLHAPAGQQSTARDLLRETLSRFHGELEVPDLANARALA